jgi:hypothetical protein
LSKSKLKEGTIRERVREEEKIQLRLVRKKTYLEKTYLEKKPY